VIGGQLTTLNVGALQLCKNRKGYVRAYSSQKQKLLFDVQRRTFECLEGVPFRVIYDNLKTAVKKILKVNHRNLQERFVEFSSLYLYQLEFWNLVELVKELEREKEDHKTGGVQRKLRGYSLVILDELGYLPFNTQGAQLLFYLMRFWYENLPVIIATNLEFKEGDSIIHNQKMTVALLDRLNPPLRDRGNGDGELQAADKAAGISGKSEGFQEGFASSLRMC
jgi:hypothetical protein